MRSLLVLGLSLAAGGSSVRSVYMNGTDISSARSQELKGVDVVINEKGDVFIIAPQYQVSEEDTYVPLSKYVQGMGNGGQGSPKHQPMQAVPKLPDPTKPMAKEETLPEAAPATAAQPVGAPIAKAGTPVSQAVLTSPPAASQQTEAPKPLIDEGTDKDK